jgi:AraC-like DNA-binding protein
MGYVEVGATNSIAPTHQHCHRWMTALGRFCGKSWLRFPLQKSARLRLKFVFCAEGSGLRFDVAARKKRCFHRSMHGYVQFQSVTSTETARHASALRVDELAACVQMSTPTFHHHFRQLAAMSPLQYQKWLRLNEARRLMHNEHQDVSIDVFTCPASTLAVAYACALAVFVCSLGLICSSMSARA